MTGFSYEDGPVMMSPLFQLHREDGMRWSCGNHMCRSPWVQRSYDGFIVCNGCMVKVPMDVLNITTIVVRENEPFTLVDSDRDLARDLTDVQRGPYPVDGWIKTMPDNTRTWLNESD